MVTLDLADTLDVRPTATGLDGRRARSPPACRSTTPTSCAGPCALVGRTRRRARRQADPRTAAGSAAARPTPPPCCGGPACDDLGRGRRRSAPTSRSASSAGGPGCGASARCVEPLPPSTRTFTLVHPAARRARRPRSTGRGTTLGGPAADGPNDLEPAALVVEPRLGRVARPASARPPAQRPVLAGSGATWFVEGAFPELVGGAAPAHRGRDAHRPPGGDPLGAVGLKAERQEAFSLGFVAAGLRPAPRDVADRSAKLARSANRGAPAGASAPRTPRRRYLLRRWNRVRFSIFLCFFLRMRLRRFLISEPIRTGEATRPPGPDATHRLL